MNRLIGPLRERFQHGKDRLKSLKRVRLIGLHLLVAIELVGVFGQRVEKVHLGGDVQPGVAPGLHQGGDELQVDAGGLDGLPQIGLGPGVKVLGGEGAQVVGVEIFELLDVEDGGGLGDAADVECSGQLVQSKNSRSLSAPLGDQPSSVT